MVVSRLSNDVTWSERPDVGKHLSVKTSNSTTAVSKEKNYSHTIQRLPASVVIGNQSEFTRHSNLFFSLVQIKSQKFNLAMSSNESLEESAESVDINEIIGKLTQQISLSPDEVETLKISHPEWHHIYQMGLDAKRMQKLQQEKVELRKIERKLQRGVELDTLEAELYEEKGHKLASIPAAHVEVDPIDLLGDIVRGDYTLHDVHLVREGAEAAEGKDPVDKSPLQFFDSIMDMVKTQTHDALHTNKAGHFFGSDPESLVEIMPGQMKGAVDRAATAIDIVQQTQADSNEAREACESFIQALAMNEAEIKLKHLKKIVAEGQAHQEGIEKLAEIAAVSGAVSDGAAQKAQTTLIHERQKSKHLDFNVTEMNFDVSFLPSEDPDVYKPLEIISYIGMTKNTQ